MCIICNRNTPYYSKIYNGIKEISNPLLECPNITTITKDMLPDKLEKLKCSFMPKLTSIESIPNSLLTLDCDYCFSLTDIKGLRNSNLKDLSCRNCHNLEKISLPETLKFFSCDSCPNLRTLTVDNTLPDSLIYLNCGDCLRLENIPILPRQIRSLTVSFPSNSIGTLMPWLEDYPETLETLAFSDGTYWKNKETKKLVSILQ